MAVWGWPIMVAVWGGWCRLPQDCEDRLTDEAFLTNATTLTTMAIPKNSPALLRALPWVDGGGGSAAGEQGKSIGRQQAGGRAAILYVFCLAEAPFEEKKEGRGSGGKTEGERGGGE